MRRQMEREDRLLYMMGAARLYGFFSPIINADHFADKFLIIGWFKCLTKGHPSLYRSYRGIENFFDRVPR